MWKDSQSRQKLDELFSLTYEELRRLADKVKGSHGSQTLNPTALVNETWIKLARERSDLPDSLSEFKRIAARAMRQVLIDASRRRSAYKRDWGVAMPMLALENVPAERVITPNEYWHWMQR